MKKVLIATILTIGIMFSGAFISNITAAETIQPLPSNGTQSYTPSTPSGVSASVPLRLCFLPKVWYWPKGLNVYGFNVGLPISYGEGEKVCGWDMALIASMTDGIRGLQTSIVNKGYQMKGGEVALVNFAHELVGCQIGVVNSQSTSDAVQIGLINLSQQSNGIQLGLLNIMDNGFLPVFPFINFSL